MTGEEYPSPSPLVFHSTRGPPVGQEVSSPVSLEMPSRCGPRNCGQSAAIAEREKKCEQNVPHKPPAFYPERWNPTGINAASSCSLSHVQSLWRSTAAAG